MSSGGITPINAIKHACTALDISYTKASRVSKSTSHISLFEVDFAKDKIPVMKSYFIDKGELKSVFDITIYEADGSDCWNVLIDAQTGCVI